MEIFFESKSYQIANGKWVPKFHRIIRNKSNTKIQENSLNKQFDSKGEANKYTTSYCLQRGYTQVDKK